MKKRTIIILFLAYFGINHVCIAQGQSNIDSLLLVLKTSKDDTDKVNTLKRLAAEYSSSSRYEESKKIGLESLALAKKLGYENGMASALLTIGTAFYSQGDYVIAFEKYKDAVALISKLTDKSIIGNCYLDIGMVLSRQGNYPEALKNHRVALNCFKEAGDRTGLAKAFSNLGVVYYEKGQYPEALQYYFTYLKMVERDGDKKLMATAYVNIGIVYDAQHNTAVAMKFYEMALALDRQTGDKSGMAQCYSYMANNYYRRDSVATAIDYNKRAFAIFEEIGDKAWSAYVRNTLAQMNANGSNYKQALEDYSSSLKTFGEIGDTFNLFASYQGMAGLYYKQGMFKEAIKCLENALVMARKINGRDNINSCYINMAGTYEAMNDYKNALEYYEMYVNLNDSLFNEKKSMQIAEINTKYETEKKDQDIALLNKDKEIKEVEIKKQKLLKYSFIGGLGLIIVLLLFGYRNYRSQQVMRLQNIRNKISGDLHDDIGSTLNSISIYSEVARKKDGQQDEALEMIGEASRKIIDAMSDIVWSINPDNDSFSKIIFRMKSLAYNLFRAKKIEFTFHSDETLNEKKLSLEERRNFYLIFKEAVNNLVKYSNASRAAITLTNENEFIKLRIQDDGIGFDTSQNNTGNGLKNMKRRAGEMKAAFKIESAPGNGTQIELILKS